VGGRARKSGDVTRRDGLGETREPGAERHSECGGGFVLVGLCGEGAWGSGIERLAERRGRHDVRATRYDTFLSIVDGPFVSSGRDVFFCLFPYSRMDICVLSMIVF
jgi:hypothetical protein